MCPCVVVSVTCISISRIQCVGVSYDAVVCVFTLLWWVHTTQEKLPATIGRTTTNRRTDEGILKLNLWTEMQQIQEQF
jgi:uncharacterized membrane-anchored protein